MIYFSFCYTSSTDMTHAKNLLENCLHSLTGYIIGINPIGTSALKWFRLYQNYPNPFNFSTSIEFDLPQTSDVSLIIYNILGKEIYRKVFNNLREGKYQINFDASPYASGTYFYKLVGENFSDIRKMILLK